MYARYINVNVKEMTFFGIHHTLTSYIYGCKEARMEGWIRGWVWREDQGVGDGAKRLLGRECSEPN